MAYNTVDNIKTMYLQYLDDHRNELEAWEKVKVCTKKNGEPFHSLQKNFEGASVHLWSYASNTNQKQLTVYYKSDRLGYRHASIDIYDHLTSGEIRINTIPEILEKIENHKSYLRRYIKDYEDALENIGALHVFMENVQGEVDKIKNDTLRRAATSMLREAYFNS